jgi:hypothetical protein
MRKTYKKYKTHKSKKYKLNKGSKLLRKTIRRKVSNHRNKTLTGGALIGQGNYGCVFRPDLTASNASLNNGNAVSKVVLKNNAFSEYRHEYKILKKMRDIDPKGLFHSLLIDAYELEDKHVPADFQQCSLTKPTYDIDEFFVFNIAFAGSKNLTYYLKNAFSVQKMDTPIIEPAVLFSLLTNIIIGIKKMIAANILHKTLDTESVFLSEPISLDNPFCAKVIDYGDGELRKYKGYSDKNQDYINFFKSVIKVLSTLLGQQPQQPQQPQQRNHANNKVISDLIQGFTVLLGMVEKNNVSYNEVVKSYIILLERIFGKKYADFARREYKLL